MNWINSWKAYNKKRVFEVNIRLGKLTVLEIITSPKLKIMILKKIINITLIVSMTPRLSMMMVIIATKPKSDAEESNCQYKVEHFIHLLPITSRRD